MKKKENERKRKKRKEKGGKRNERKQRKTSGTLAPEKHQEAGIGTKRNIWSAVRRVRNRRQTRFDSRELRPHRAQCDLRPQYCPTLRRVVKRDTVLEFVITLKRALSRLLEVFPWKPAMAYGYIFCSRANRESAHSEYRPAIALIELIGFSATQDKHQPSTLRRDCLESRYDAYLALYLRPFRRTDVRSSARPFRTS